MVSLADVTAARRLVDTAASRTPMLDSRTFSELSGATVLLKAECFQKTGSFKIRGATNRLHHLSVREREVGVVASSAGNHAQGVALAARTVGVPATIFMPIMAPLSKQAATRGYGAEVVLEGESFDEAQMAARAHAERLGVPFLSAFDDVHIVAGQGTLGLELLEDVADLDLVIVPVGGGGLISGVATAIKALRPAVRVVGVQAAGCSSYRESLQAGTPIAAPAAATLADGIAVKRPGDITFPIVQRLVDEMHEVSDEEIIGAILLLAERAKLVSEGAGAAALALLLSGRLAVAGQKVAVVVSGGNLDPGLMQQVVRAGLTNAGRYLTFRTRIGDRPGALARLLQILADDRMNIVHVLHHREGVDVGVHLVDVELTVETRDREHAVAVLNHLEREGYETERVS